MVRALDKADAFKRSIISGAICHFTISIIVSSAPNSVDYFLANITKIVTIRRHILRLRTKCTNSDIGRETEKGGGGCPGPAPICVNDIY